MTDIQLGGFFLFTIWLFALWGFIKYQLKKPNTITLSELIHTANYDYKTGLWTDKNGKCYELISKDKADEVLYREAEYNEYEYMTALHSLTDDKHGS